jgi:hypothetical protein
MNRKLKALGMAIAAVMAFAAFAGSASAAEFHSEVAHTQISGAQVKTDVFTTNAGTVKCSEATYSGTQTTGVTSTQVTAEAKYGGCTAFGFVGATIHMNGCDYLFTSNPNPYLHILCPAGKVIEVTTPSCVITVPAQTVNSGVTYVNVPGNGTTTRHITVQVALSGLTYTQDPGPFPGCTGGGGTFTNGTYTGEATIKGANTAGTQVGIWWA